MSDTKHTPKPWTANAVIGRKIVGGVNSANFDKILICGTNATVATVYRREDARLIAAAPDLLEAAEYVIGWNAKTWDSAIARDMLKRAIAKARGERGES